MEKAQMRAQAAAKIEQQRILAGFYNLRREQQELLLKLLLNRAGESAQDVVAQYIAVAEKSRGSESRREVTRWPSGRLRRTRGLRTSL